MPTPDAERAIQDAQARGRALLKFISPNDAGATGSHQAGFYLPKRAWRMFTSNPPEDDTNSKHPVEILWPDGRTTDSVVHWYGRGTRSEYRLTRFGRDFPYLNDDAVGGLLVLIPMTLESFRAYVLDLDDDVDELQAALGVETYDSWGIYDARQLEPETENQCLSRKFREFVNDIEDDFPSGLAMSLATRNALYECIDSFSDKDADQKLLLGHNTEYSLYRRVERVIYGPDLVRVHDSIDSFLKIANSITNRRRSRAGAAFENHVSFVLDDAGIPFERQAQIDGQKVDFLIPGIEAYDDMRYPAERLFVVDAKTTSKDRWRQAIATTQSRVSRRHLMTLHPGISGRQCAQMRDENVHLVVPCSLHSKYPEECRNDILGVAQFIDMVEDSLRPGGLRG